MTLVSKGCIFHFHDYGRKGIRPFVTEGTRLFGTKSPLVGHSSSEESGTVLSRSPGSWGSVVAPGDFCEEVGSFCWFHS